MKSVEFLVFGLTAIVFAAGWYFARIGRRVREAKEADARAAQESARAAAELSSSAQIAREFGAFMEATVLAYGDEPATVFDVSLLPFPKSEIQRALFLLMPTAAADKDRAALSAALAFLCQFQRGVGRRALRASSVPGLHDDLSAIARAYSHGDLHQATRLIVSAGRHPDYARWLRFADDADAEIANTKAMLDRIERRRLRAQAAAE